MPNVKVPKSMIVDAAFAVTTECGIEAVTADAVAQRLQCSKQPIYWVFKNMDALKTAILKKAVKLYSSQLFEKVPGHSRIRGVAFNYIRFAQEYPHLFRLIFFSNRQEYVRIMNNSLDENKPKVIRLIHDTHGITEAKAEDVYIKIGIFCNGIASMIISKTATFTDEDITRLVIETFDAIKKGATA